MATKPESKTQNSTRGSGRGTTARGASRGGSRGGRGGAKKKSFVKTPVFTIDEILRLGEKYPSGGWMSLDTANESQTETMKQHDQRYLDILAKGINEKKEDVPPRPLRLETTPFRTTSRCKAGKIDEGKMPSSVQFQTRIKFPNVKDEKELNTKLDDLADDTVNEKFPGIPQDQFEAKAEQQRKLLDKEHRQERAFAIINTEYERLLNSTELQDAIDWTPSAKQVVQGNVQYSRKYNKDTDKDLPKPKDGLVPLDEPIVYFKIQIDKKDGGFYCKIYDLTVPVPAGKPRPFASAVNQATGKSELLNVNTIEEWFRPTSVAAVLVAYQCCICKDGAMLHAKVKELNVRRAAQSEAQAQIKGDTIDQMSDYGGQFETAPSGNTALVPVVAPKPVSNLEDRLSKMINDDAGDDN